LYTYNSAAVRDLIFVNGTYDICSIEKLYGIPTTPLFELLLKVNEEKGVRIIEAKVSGNEMLEFFNCLGLFFILLTLVILFVVPKNDTDVLLGTVGLGVLVFIISYKINKRLVRGGVKVLDEIEDVLKEE